MKLVVRKFNKAEKLSLRLKRLRAEDIPIAWSAIRDQCIVNTEFLHHDAWWFFPNLVRALSHEWVHKVIYRVAGFSACYKFDSQHIDRICDLNWIEGDISYQ